MGNFWAWHYFSPLAKLRAANSSRLSLHPERDAYAYAYAYATLRFA